MKLVRQVSLLLLGGATEKVYKAELYELGPDRFVVNFRHGRRGDVLKEGTKTTTAVARPEADRIFERLVASKKAEGYFDESGPPPAKPAAPAPSAPAPLAPRERAIIDVLSGAKKSSDEQRLRALWRVVELDLAAAEPHIAPLVNASGEIAVYVVAAALGRCPTDKAFATLEKLATTTKSDMVRRMALEGGRAIAIAKGGVALDAWLDRAKDELPPALRAAAARSAEEFAKALDVFLATKDAKTPAVLAACYRVDSPNVRPALLAAIRSLPLSVPANWKALRHLYKMAEYRRDALVFGATAKRFEDARPRRAAVRNPMTGELMAEPLSDRVSRDTKAYLRRRTWRTLRRIALDGRAELYCKMAVGVLTAIGDEDAEPPVKKRKRRTDWRTPRDPTPRVWDRYARYWSFNKILYGESKRYSPGKTEHFQCVGGYQPGGLEPSAREESFPELWDRTPGAVLHLLDESDCELVHRFGVKVLRANPAALEALDAEAIAMLLGARFAVTAQVGLDVAVQKFPLDAPDEVLLALACSTLERARQDAWRRFDGLGARVVASSPLVAQLIRAPFADTRARVRALLAANPLEQDAARVIVGRLIADLRASPPADEALAIDIVKTLGAAFARELQTLDRKVVEELLVSGSTPLLVLAAEILLARQAMGEAVDGATITRLIKSEHEALRSVGVRMLGNLPEDVLVANEAVLLTLATTDLADLRESVRPIARKIAEKYPVFAANLADALVKALVVKKQPEGMHEHLLRMLKEDLAPVLDRLPREYVHMLLRAAVPQAQELGGVLLAKNVASSELSLREIIKLASHDVRLVRETACRFFAESAPRVRQDLDLAIALLDAAWEDARVWARQYFEQNLLAALGPAHLVAICDSVRPDVQQFGRELITKRFEEPQGWEYLSKLSEHPTAELQLFASNFLEGHARGSIERLRALTPYFVSVLSRVNKGRVAKDRALAFLLAEGLKSEEAARLVAQVFTRQSVTIAVGDKAECVAGLLALKKAFPEVAVPLVLKGAVP